MTNGLNKGLFNLNEILRIMRNTQNVSGSIHIMAASPDFLIKLFFFGALFFGNFRLDKR